MSEQPNQQTLATLQSYSDQCWMQATDAYRVISNEDRDRIVNALESDSLTVVMLLPGNLLQIVCGFALAAMVETRLRVERQDLDEGNEYDDHFGNFEPD